MNKNLRLDIRIDQDNLDQLYALCEDSGWSKSKMVRWLICKEYIHIHRPAPIDVELPFFDVYGSGVSPETKLDIIEP